MASASTPSALQHVTVVGAGTMGNGIAHVFAQHGHTVALVDVDQAGLDRGLATIEKNLGRQVTKGKLTEEDQVGTLARIRCSTDLAEACSKADLVVEAVTENLEVKASIFRQMDERRARWRGAREQHLVDLHHRDRRPHQARERM